MFPYTYDTAAVENNIPLKLVLAGVETPPLPSSNFSSSEGTRTGDLCGRTTGRENLSAFPALQRSGSSPRREKRENGNFSVPTKNLCSSADIVHSCPKATHRTLLSNPVKQPPFHHEKKTSRHNKISITSQSFRLITTTNYACATLPPSLLRRRRHALTL